MPRSVITVPALAFLLLCALAPPAFAVDAAPKPRARDLGIPFEGVPGRFNAITDVDGVLVGHTTLISGGGKLTVGKGPVRTGVTAILPRGPSSIERFSFAGWFAENGNGEMTGTTWVEESGFLEGPVMITNTHSVGVVRDAVIACLSNRRSMNLRTVGRTVSSVAATAATASATLVSGCSRNWPIVALVPGNAAWRCNPCSWS